MSNQLAVQQPHTDYILRVISGPDKGELFQLVSNVVTIGRASENDIALTNDPKVSRQHAEISITNQGILIKSLSDKNLVLVNGRKIKAELLSNQSKIQVGSTTFVLEVSTFIPDASGALAPTQQGPGGGLGPSIPQQELSHIPNSPPAADGLNVKAILIGVFGLLILFLLTTPPPKEAKDMEIATEEEINQNIESFNKVREAEQKLNRQAGRNTPEFKEAQALYLKGFRDYKKGQFERSLTSFEACISIFPKHDLCRTYKKLASMKYHELIQYHVIVGRKQLDTGQYEACKASFKNVMYMVKDKGSQIYSEAKARFQLCDSRLEGRF